MEIKIGKYVLREWRANANFWSRDDRNWDDNSIYIDICQNVGVSGYQLIIGRGLPKCDTFNQQQFSSIEEAKTYIDNWLISISKLQVFW